MTLAEQIQAHCSDENRRQSHEPTYGGMMSRSIPIRKLLEGKTGRKIEIDAGVTLLIPDECEWHTSQQADAGVKFTFTGPLPVVYATVGPITTPADITALVMWLGVDGFDLRALPKLGPVPLPPFDITFPFN